MENRFRLCRGWWVLLDSDVAFFFGLTTQALLERVHRHEPLAGELGFYVDGAELDHPHHGRCPHYAFTEHGVIAVGFMIGTKTAITRSVELIHAFRRVRRADTADETQVMEPREAESLA